MVLTIGQKKELHDDCIKFRRDKLKEIIEKGDKASSIEISIIQYWAEFYGNEAW